MAGSKRATRDAFNIRIRPDDRALIERAAALSGKTKTDFVLEAARRAAEETLLDRTTIRMSPEAYDDFLNRLEAPPAPNDRLRRTMTAPAPWDDE